MAKFMKSFLTSLTSLAAAFTVTVNAHANETYREQTVAYVDIDRFMGPWYVHGHTPLLVDTNAVNQVESYELREDGKIATTFNFDRFGKNWTLTPVAEIADPETNAHWKMQFVWPLKSDYLIVRLDDNYETTVVSVPDKQLIWIMSRSAQMEDSVYEQITSDLLADNYPVEKIQRVTHLQ